LKDLGQNGHVKGRLEGWGSTLVQNIGAMPDGPGLEGGDTTLGGDRTFVDVVGNDILLSVVVGGDTPLSVGEGNGETWVRAFSTCWFSFCGGKTARGSIVWTGTCLR